MPDCVDHTYHIFVSVVSTFTLASAEYYIVKSKTVTAGGIELTAELRSKDTSTSFVNAIASVEGVENATLVSYNGDYMS